MVKFLAVAIAAVAGTSAVLAADVTLWEQKQLWMHTGFVARAGGVSDEACGDAMHDQNVKMVIEKDNTIAFDSVLPEIGGRLVGRMRADNENAYDMYREGDDANIIGECFMGTESGNKESCSSWGLRAKGWGYCNFNK